MRFVFLLFAMCMLWACTSTTTVTYPVREMVHNLSYRRMQEPLKCSGVEDSLAAFEAFTFSYDSIYSGFITRWHPPVRGTDSCKSLDQHLLQGCFTPDIAQIKKDVGPQKIEKATLEILSFQQKIFPVALLKTTAWNHAVFQKIDQPLPQQQATFQVQKVLSPWEPCKEIQFCKKSGLITAPLSVTHRSKFSVPLKQPFQVDITKELKQMLENTHNGNTGFCIAPTAPETFYQANNTILGSFVVRFHIQLKNDDGN